MIIMKIAKRHYHSACCACCICCGCCCDGGDGCVCCTSDCSGSCCCRCGCVCSSCDCSSSLSLRSPFVEGPSSCPSEEASVARFSRLRLDSSLGSRSWTDSKRERGVGALMSSVYGMPPKSRCSAQAFFSRRRSERTQGIVISIQTMAQPNGRAHPSCILVSTSYSSQS